VNLSQALQEAAARREALLEQLDQERTDCYRVFHGVAEGRPGLAIDRYGDTLLGQLWGTLLDDYELNAITEALGPITWRYRGTTQPDTKATWCHELGLSFAFQAIHEGIDPWVFLDFRAGRRWLSKHVAENPGCRVLNTFAYTATAGVVAAAAGASEVINLDHARNWTHLGRRNAHENGVQMTFFQLDYFAAVRQMAGLKVGRKGRRLPNVKHDRFDVIVLDPPTLTKGPFGAVDIVRDYPGLFKPAWMCLEEDGALLATNHHAGVDLDDWLASCRRCAEKTGRPVRDVEVLAVDADFPSFDGSPPLKMVVFR
jgi:23S rRNA (cytosine1962-C5)-methyltransferase